MSYVPEPGAVLGIPCRHCGAFVDVTLKSNRSSFYCSTCGRTTDIVLVRRADMWEVRTAPVKQSSVREPQD